MRYVLWAALIASAMTLISVYAEAGEEAARVAPKALNRLPASNLDPIPTEDTTALPDELNGASIEVGFSQDNEPEPHLLAVSGVDRVQLFQLEPKAAVVTDRPPANGAKTMPARVFAKRLRQAVEANRFFAARQPKPKRRCHDRYVVRIRMGDRVRERRGCTNQSNDPFAAFSQLFFRDAFIVWSRAERAPASSN